MKIVSVIALLVVGSVAPVMAADVRVPGKVEGFGALPIDDIVNGSLVLKSFRPEDITQFRIEQFVSPSEPLKAGPKTINVPGNFFVPRQVENWGFFKITIEKSEYGYYSAPGAKEEVIATSFTAPFSDLMDAAQSGRTSPSQLLPMVSLKRFDFKPLADYSKNSRVDFKLSGNFVDGPNFNWSRSRADRGETDHIFAFQETPASRWILSDLIGNAGPKGRIKMAEGFSDRQKILFARLREVDNNLKGIRARVSEQPFAEGVPDRIANARIEGGAVLWDAPRGPGWMSVLTEQRHVSTLRNSYFWFFDLKGLFDIGTRVSHTWVDPADGSFVMLPPDGTDPSTLAVTLAFVGTDREVAHPDLDPNNELFEHMESIVVEVLR
ncbi:hypothetical protein GW915_13395 [bacterium]|nr:hypothetical protein [bacterium]